MTKHTLGYWEDIADASFGEMKKHYGQYRRSRRKITAKHYAARLRRLKQDAERILFDLTTLQNNLEELS